MKKDLVDEFRAWERTHNRENYGRYDAFAAGYRLAEVRIENLGRAIKRHHDNCEQLDFGCSEQCIDLCEALAEDTHTSTNPDTKLSNAKSDTITQIANQFMNENKELMEDLAKLEEMETCQHRWAHYSNDSYEHCRLCGERGEPAVKEAGE